MSLGGGFNEVDESFCALAKANSSSPIRLDCASNWAISLATCARNSSIIESQYPNWHRDQLIRHFKQVPLLKPLYDLINESPAAGLKLPLHVQGTAFQQRVWKVLGQISCSKSFTYSEVAEQLGQPKAIRAVASACAANTMAIAIPCHRGTLSQDDCY